MTTATFKSILSKIQNPLPEMICSIIVEYITTIVPFINGSTYYTSYIATNTPYLPYLERIFIFKL